MTFIKCFLLKLEIVGGRERERAHVHFEPPLKWWQWE